MAKKKEVVKKDETKEVEVKEESKKETNTKDEPKKTTPKKSTPKKKSEPKAKGNIDKLVENTTKVATRAERDMNEMISVISIVKGGLTYQSKAQRGYTVEWGEFLEESWMEYKELVTMRNTQKAFFTNPWIICEWDVLEDLKVTQYYKNIIDLSNLDDIFKKRPDELRETLEKVPTGIRALVVDRAYELIQNKELDSMNVIEVIEEVCNVDLMV